MSKPLCRVNCEVGNYTPSDIENLNLVEKIFSCYLNKGPLVGNVLPLFDITDWEIPGGIYLAHLSIIYLTDKQSKFFFRAKIELHFFIENDNGM